MNKSIDNYDGIEVLSLSDPSIYRFLEQSDRGWEELPDDFAFRHLDAKPVRRRRNK